MWHHGRTTISTLALAAALGLAWPVAPLAQDGSAVPDKAQRKPPRIVNIDACRPEYPKEAAKAGEVGSTRVRVRVSAEGLLLDARVVRSSGFERLDSATLSALRHCAYTPGTVDGAPAEAEATINYNWRLEDRVKAHLYGCLAAVYPEESLHAEEQGTTVLRIWVSATGGFERAEVEKSSGFERLDRAAVEFVATCTFRVLPRSDGSVSRGPFRIQYVWRLDDGPAPPATSTPPAPDPYRPL